MKHVVQEPAEMYHAKKEFISSTPLKQMALSPRHFFEAWTKPEIEETEAMKNGELIHSLILEQDVKKFCARPLDEKGNLVRSNSKEYLAFLENNKGKTPVHPDLFNQMNECLTAFCENRIALEFLDKAKIEHSIYTVDHQTGLKMKARPDGWKDGVLIDVKTTGKRLDQFFIRTIFANNYDLQLAHYAECIKAATGEVIKEYYIIAIEQKAPFSSRVYRLNPSDISAAKQVHRQYLNQIKVCLDDNKFPSYVNEVIEAEKPSYMESTSELNFNVG
jgi:hypothetical protein